MAINIINSLLVGEIGLNSLKVTKASTWTMQIMGAYNFLYPYIAQDFRGLLDCTTCHEQMSKQYSLDLPGEGGKHTAYLPPLVAQTLQQIDPLMMPISKRGGDNIGTYEI